MKAMKLLHKTVKKVGEDIVDYKFNTAISALMILQNEGVPSDADFANEWKEKFLTLLHPFAPHVAQEEVSLLAHADPGIAKWIEGKTLVKEIFIPNKMLSIVVKD